MAEGALEIRLLGELQVLRGGQPVALPASKQTRALLGYLVATREPHSREQLCDLLWEGPDDPRAALRWSLTKLRPIVNDHDALRLNTDREHVTFALTGVDLDIAHLEQNLPNGIAAASTSALEAAASLLHGEFLDGLDLPRCYRFHAWCMRERGRWDALRSEVLGELVKRVAEDCSRALQWARTWIAADPLCEEAHAQVVRLLAAAGRVREANEHFERACTLLERELGEAASGRLRQAHAAARCTRSVDATPRRTPAPRAEPEHIALPLVGRRAEQTICEQALRDLQLRRVAVHLMLLGEPGIGKTRLLDALAELGGSRGLRVLRGRGFEAEMVRPYGPWIDALRSVPVDAVPAEARRYLSLLVPGLDAISGGDGDRLQLLDGMVTLLTSLSAAVPTLLIIDDVQWLDEASTALLHYAARAFTAPAPLLIAIAAREGEIDDNAALARAWQSLRREHRLLDLRLGPLDEDATQELVRHVDPKLDGGELYRRSEGNPLIVLELARAATAGEAEGGTFSDLIAAHLTRIEPEARELLGCAAAFGRAIRPEIMGTTLALTSAELSAQIQLLERRDMLRGTAAGGYDFSHDLLRQAVYRSLSQPRRRLLHRQIARALEAESKRDESLVADLAHHADLAEDHPLAAEASQRAGKRCLRLFANVEAARLATAGLRHAAQLPPGVERTRLRLGLLCLQSFAVFGDRQSHDAGLVRALGEAIAEAESASLNTEAAEGLVALSYVHQRSGDGERARDATLLAAEALVNVDPLLRLQQLANTARCLLDVEVDIEHARALMMEVENLAKVARASFTELEWSRGLWRRWDGDLQAAVTFIEHALELARACEDHRREYECLVWLARLDFEVRALDRLEQRCSDLDSVAARLGSPDAPLAAALRALGDIARCKPDADANFERATRALREIDDKIHLCYLLNEAAALYLLSGRLATASACAEEANLCGRALRRGTEIVAAAAILAQVHAAQGDLPAAESELRQARHEARRLGCLSARAAQYLERASNALEPAISTGIPTVVST